MGRFSLFFALGIAALLTQHSWASAQDATENAPAADGAAALVQPQPVEDQGPAARIDCAADSQALFEGRVYLACNRRLLIVDPAEPRVVHDEIQAERILGFHESGGALWLELANGTARRVAQVAPSEPLPEARPSAEHPGVTVASGAARGRIVSVRDDQVVLDMGRSSGLEIGHRVDLSARAAEDWDASESAVIGVVDAVEEDRARVRLRWRESVDPSSSAVATSSEPTGSIVGPPAPPRGFRVHANLLISTPVEDLGLQLAVRGSVEFRARRYLLARVRLLPSGVSVGKGDDFGTAGATAELGFDQRFVGASFGVGVQRLFDRDSDEGNAGVALPTTFRIGALDGLLVEGTTMLTIRDGQLDFLSFAGRFQAPLRNGLWMGVRGEGGRSSPFWYSEAYVRVALRGNGLPRTTLLELGAGVLGSTDRTPAPDNRFGPSLSVGVVHTL